MGKEKQPSIPVLGVEKRRFPRLKYSGLYDGAILINKTREWLAKHYWMIVDSEHTESIKPQGKEIKVVMKPFKNVTMYVRYFMEIEIVILREIDVLVKENGKQTRKQRGDMEIGLKAHFLKNYKQTFHKTGIGEFLRRVYEKYIIKQQLKDHEEKLREEAYELLDVMKGLLGTFKRKEGHFHMVK